MIGILAGFIFGCVTGALMGRNGASFAETLLVVGAGIAYAAAMKWT